MKPDRRLSAQRDRRQHAANAVGYQISPDGDPASATPDALPTVEVDEVSSADAVAARERHAETMDWREGRALLRETAIGEREGGALAREDVAGGRELAVLQREMSATSREQDLHTLIGWKAAQTEDRNVKLRLANEQLVLSSVQLLVAREEIEKSRAEILHLAQHDFLTDLPNRVQLFDRIGQAILLAKRHPAKLAVLFLDLDRFKIINDSYGHAMGDQLLKAAAQRLTSAVRSSDTISRHGGDEFIIILSEAKQLYTLERKIIEIHQAVTAPYFIDGIELRVGATIGVSVFPDDGEDAVALIRAADSAMYFAKQNGRNGYKFFTHEMRALDAERRSVEVSLRQAVEQHQFELFYQAQINLESGAVTGAEALIRWRHPSRGLLLPAWFVPIAEDSGAIVAMGRWVLREACRQAKSWLDAGLTLDVIAVNISAREFENGNFLECISLVLRETGLAPHHLELELTETVLMKNFEASATTLRALRSMGVKISIDDFGTGYSSLSYLKNFPFDTLKIDQSFVRDISNGPDDVLLSAIIGIGIGLQHHV
ncbi:putative bifunctional diguanylate cyclase/phosphodiesterase, partial [Massilia glaciei]